MVDGRRCKKFLAMEINIIRVFVVLTLYDKARSENIRQMIYNSGMLLNEEKRIQWHGHLWRNRLSKQVYELVL